VLALNLAGGPNSGVGLVLLIPLVWCALYHRWGETLAVAVAVVAVEVITSVGQSAAAAVTTRRAILWALLSAVILVATHRLRDQLSRSHQESMRLQEQVQQLTLVSDRDRIAAELQEQVVSKLFAAGLAMQSAAAMTTSPAVRDRVERSISELDDSVSVLREAVFGLSSKPRAEAGLRQRVLDLCRGLPDPPEAAFDGGVDAVLTPPGQDQVVSVLREAMTLLATQGTVKSLGLAETGSALVITCSAELPPGAGSEFFAVGESAERAGVEVEVAAGRGGVVITWLFPAGVVS
jgi:signal transduction histidine kinase